MDPYTTFPKFTHYFIPNRRYRHFLNKREAYSSDFGSILPYLSLKQPRQLVLFRPLHLKWGPKPPILALSAPCTWFESLKKDSLDPNSNRIEQPFLFVLRELSLWLERASIRW